MDEKTVEGLLQTLTMYQHAFNTFYKENRYKKDFTLGDAIQMANGWWHGIALTAISNIRKEDDEW